ncbi:MAG: tetratricopeptide repeat protein [Candidatus Brocadia sp.]|nr:tetratricopeptide repeat protein [Candidatus Brocadia sp.]
MLFPFKASIFLYALVLGYSGAYHESYSNSQHYGRKIPLSPLSGILCDSFMPFDRNRAAGMFSYFRRKCPVGRWERGGLRLSHSHLPELSNSNYRQPFSTVMAGLVLVPAVLYLPLAIERNKVWRDQFTFWSKTLEVSPNSSRAHNNLGLAYFRKGLLDASRDEFKLAIRYEPDHA